MVTDKTSTEGITSFSSARLHKLLDHHPYFKHRQNVRKANFSRFIPEAEQRMLESEQGESSQKTPLNRQFPSEKLNHVSVANWLDKDKRPRHLDAIVAILLHEMSITSSQEEVIAWLTLQTDEIDLTPLTPPETPMDFAEQAAMFVEIHKEARRMNFDYESLNNETLNAMYQMIKQCWHLPNERRSNAMKAILQVFNLLCPAGRKEESKSKELIQQISALVDQLGSP